MKNKQQKLKRGIGILWICTLMLYAFNKEWAWLLGLYVLSGLFIVMLAIATGEIKKFTNPFVAYLSTFLLGPPKGLISWFKD